MKNDYLQWINEDGYTFCHTLQPTKNKKEIIENFSPHYSNELFKKAQLVFGEKCETDSCAYSDRLEQWDYDKARMAREIANSTCTQNTGLWVEKYLSEYFNRSVEIKYIMAGFNISNGYEYQFFAWNWIN